MHLGHLGFEETGRQAITQHLLEAIDAIFGETAAMITDRFFSFGQAPRGDVRLCLGARVIGFPRHGIFLGRHRHSGAPFRHRRVHPTRVVRAIAIDWGIVPSI